MFLAALQTFALRSARRQTIAYMCRSRKCAGDRSRDPRHHHPARIFAAGVPLSRHCPRSPLGLKDLVADADASIGEIRLCLI
jgi:hypothetical protein